MMSLRAYHLLLPLFVFAATADTRGEDVEAALPFNHPHAHEAILGHFHLGWESRYFTEGRDELDGDSLAVTSMELGWNHLTGGIFYGLSPEQEYDELQLSAALTEQVGAVEFYVGYTHLRFPFEDAHDNEVGTGFVWGDLPLGLELAFDLYWSFEADGYFSELALAREFEVTDRFAIGIGGIFGINQGYVSDGHDGANHLAVGLDASYALTETISLTAHATQSFALDADATLEGDESLVDFFHAAVGIEWSF